MKRKSTSLHVVLFAPLALAGCSAPGEPTIGGEERVAETAQAVVASNGRSLNGRSLNGRSLNGRSLNGRSLNGVALGGVSLEGGPAIAVSLDETVFRDASKDKEIKKKDLIGASFTGTLDDQTTLDLRIDAIDRSPEDSSIRVYAVSYATDEGWRSLCADDDGEVEMAIPLAGRWSYAEGVPGGGAWIADPSAFTFACRGHALAKCVELGYAPWERAKVKVPGGNGHTSVSLADHHQACTRLIRADYCGDGKSYTLDGTLLNLYDGLGVQDDTEGWSFEAEWGPNGARCVAQRRELDGATPSCWASLPTIGCGSRSHFATGTLLMNEDSPLP